MIAAIPLSDLYYGAAIAGSFLVAIGLAEVLRLRLSVGVEWTRKLVHFSGGIICLSMPFLIQSHWVVLVLAIAMGAIFVLSRRLGWLTSIHGVSRHSRGTEYYPVVIYLLFLLCASTPWKFVVCVLVLSVADSAAAIVGTKYGRLKFRVEAEQKSVEGSLAFFIATLIVVWIPLIIFKPKFGELLAPNWHYFLASVLIGLLVTCFEAVSGRGRDNLWIPLGTFLVLTKTFQTDVADLILQNISFAIILCVTVVLSKVSRTFHTGGAIVLCLASYGCWAMGSFDWALPVFIGFGLYVTITLLVHPPWRLTIRPVVFNVLIPFLVLVLGNVALNLDRSDLTQFWFGPFLASCCLALAQGLINQASWQGRKKLRRRYLIGGAAGLACFVLLVLPSAVRLSMNDALTISIFCGVVVIMAMISATVLRPVPPPRAPIRWLQVRTGFSILAVIVIAVLQWFSICKIWQVPV